MEKIYENKILKNITKYLPMANTFVVKEENIWGCDIKKLLRKKLIKIQKEIIEDGLLVIPIRGMEMDYRYCYRQYFYVLDRKDYDLDNPIIRVWDNYEGVWYNLPDPEDILRISCKNFRSDIVW